MSDNDWDVDNFESQSFTTGATPSSKWVGEDEEEEVKDNWEDFDDDEKANKENDAKESKEVIQQVKVKKKKKILIAEKEEKKRKEAEQKLLDSEENLTPLTPEEQVQEKLKQQRLQEDSDLELAKHTFGVSNDSKPSLESMQLSCREDFDAFKKALVETITRHEKSAFYFAFLDDFVRELCLDIDSEEIKKLSNTLNVLANEKVKAVKASKGKKKGKGKISLNVGKKDFDYNDDYEGGNEFDDFM